MNWNLKCAFVLVYCLVFIGGITNFLHAGEESPVVSGLSLKLSGYSLVDVSNDVFLAQFQVGF